MTGEQGPVRPREQAAEDAAPEGADLDDTLLAARAREGDEEAFEALVRRHGPPLVRVAGGLLPSRADAPEAVRQAFVSAWRRLPAVRDDPVFATWLHRLVTDRCLARPGARRPAPRGSGPHEGGPGPGRAAGQPSSPAADALTASVMAAVRREARPGRTLSPGPAGRHGPVTEAAAARALRAAAESLPGVRAGSCRVLTAPAADTPDLPASGGQERPPGYSVCIEVAADWSWEVPRLAPLVRERVAAAALSTVGAEPAAVDVTVVDLLGPSPVPDPPR